MVQCAAHALNSPPGHIHGQEEEAELLSQTLCPQHPRAADGTVYKLSCFSLSKPHPLTDPKPGQGIWHSSSPGQGWGHFGDSSGRGSMQEDATLILIHSLFLCAVPGEATLHWMPVSMAEQDFLIFIFNYFSLKCNGQIDSLDPATMQGLHLEQSSVWRESVPQQWRNRIQTEMEKTKIMTKSDITAATSCPRGAFVYFCF